MEAESSSPTHPANRNLTISAGDTVLLRVPNGEVRAVKVEQNSTVALGRLGSFEANELIGEPYGTTYEMVKKRLVPMPPRSLQDVEDTDATNELINDGEFVQPLTGDEIRALKQSEVHASDIIQKQIEMHANYSLKTEFSKEKYKKRKEAKYLKSFTTVEPTIFNACDYWFCKDQSRIRDLRPDALSQMLNLANIRSGGRYLAVDDASGIVVAGILDRMGGKGRLMTISDNESPPAYPAMTVMNFLPHVTEGIVRSLNWATMQKDHTAVTAPTEVAPDDVKSDRQRQRIQKRKLLIDNLNNTRNDLFSGGFDALVIASQYDPNSIVEALFPYLGGSANIVVHSPYVQVLVDVQSKMRNIPGFLFPCITEPWLRRYQVLPGRTHPTMMTAGTGGYILHATKVVDGSAARPPGLVPLPTSSKPVRVEDLEQIDTEMIDQEIGDPIISNGS